MVAVKGKFKVGDRVKTSGYTFDPSVGTILSGGDDSLLTVRLDKIPAGEKKADWLYYPSELEHAPLFAVGDKVRIARARHDFKEGHIGREFTITEQQGEIDGEPVWIGYPESRPYVWASSELEPVAVAASNDNAAERVRSLVDQYDVKKGCVYEVAERDGDCVWVLDDIGDRFYLISHEFESVSPPTADSGCAAAQVDNLRDEYGPYGEKEGDAKDELTLHITADFTDFHEQIDAAFDRLAKLEEKASSLGIRFQAA